MGNAESQAGGYKNQSSANGERVWAQHHGDGERDHHAWSDEESGIKSQGSKWVGAESGFTPSGKNLKSVRSHPDEAFPCGAQHLHQRRAGSESFELPHSEDGKGRKQKSGIASSLRRFMSGKAGKRDALPTSVQDLSDTSGEGRDLHASPVSGDKNSGKRINGINIRQQRVTASPGGGGGGAGGQDVKNKDDIVQMCKYLGIDLKTKEGKAFRWLAEEALGAVLPAGWEEHKSDEGVSYYYNTATGKSIWEHPMDAYYHFLLSKMRKMRRANKGLAQRDGPAQRAKDRELIDLLWAMEKEQQAAGEEQVANNSDSSGTGSSRSNFLGSSTLSDSSFYSSSDASPCSSRMGSVTPQLDLEMIPDDVKETAAALGINLETLNTPVTIEEVSEMAEYLGIDVMREGYLLPLVKMALQAPLPKGWEVYKDDKGEPFYSHRRSGKTSYRHPADDYFMKKVQEDRGRHVKAVQEGSAVKASEPWLDFIDDTREQHVRYWYNFRTKEVSKIRPALYSVLSESAAGSGEAGGVPAVLNGRAPPVGDGVSGARIDAVATSAASATLS